MTTSSTTPWVETPLIESSILSKAAGCLPLFVDLPSCPCSRSNKPTTFLNRRSRILLKLESLQPSGSFKARGIGHLCQTSLSASPNPSTCHFYSSSGGNAGLAAVHSARRLGRPATVCVPHSTKPLMLTKLRAAGAHRVLQYGASWKEADAYLRDVVIPEARAAGQDAIYIHPFDDPAIWTGHASLTTELDDQMQQHFDGVGAGAPDVLVCSVGGGGLLNGLVQGADALGASWSKTQILAVETRGADSLAKSLEVGEHVTLPGITSIATSLGAVRVSDKTWELASTRRDRIRSVVLSDEEAAMGCWRLADDERIVVEPACGVNVALCYGGRLERALGRKVGPEERVVIVVCGGSAVTVEQLAEWKRVVGCAGDEISEGEREVVASAVVNGV